jgi:hypothetical protein
MNLNLPFQLALALPCAPFNGTLKVVLKPTPAEPGEILEREDYAGALSLLALFAKAVDAQMFLLAPKAGPSQLAVTDIGWNSQQRWCEMIATAANLPLFAWLHLVALLKKNHDAFETLDLIQVQASGVTQILDPAEIQAHFPPSTLYANYPFEFENGGMEKSKNIRIELEFQDDLPKQNVAVISERLQLWLEFILLGGFDLSLADADDLDPMGYVEQTSPVRIQCMVPYYCGDNSGFEALMRMLLAIHVSVQILSAVSIE